MSLAGIGLFSYRSLKRLPNQIVYFVVSEDNNFSLKAVARISKANNLKDNLIDATKSLIIGPNSSEKAQGLATSFPQDTQLLGLKINADEVTVDFSNEFLSPQGISASTGLLNQVFYSLSQPKSIDKVKIFVDGSPLNYIGGEGIVVEQPWIRISDKLPKW